MSNAALHHRRGSGCEYCKAREKRIADLEDLDTLATNVAVLARLLSEASREIEELKKRVDVLERTKVDGNCLGPGR